MFDPMLNPTTGPIFTKVKDDGPAWTREEFEAVKQMAAKARDDNQKLSQKVAALEAAVKAEPKGPGE